MNLNIGNKYLYTSTTLQLTTKLSSIKYLNVINENIYKFKILKIHWTIENNNIHLVDSIGLTTQEVKKYIRNMNEIIKNITDFDT